MRAKHERLSTKALMLASRSGFTPEAVRAAKSYGIETFRLGNVETTDFPALLSQKSTLWAKTFTLSPEAVRARVYPATDSAAEVVRLAPDNSLYDSVGTELGPMSQLVELSLKSTQLADYFLAEGTVEHRWFSAIHQHPRTAAGEPFFLRKPDPPGLRQIEYLHVEGPIAFTVSSFGVSRGKLGDVQVAWGKTKLGNWNAMLVVTRDAGGSERITVETSPERPPLQ